MKTSKKNKYLKRVLFAVFFLLAMLCALYKDLSEM